MSGLPSWARVGAKVVCIEGSVRRYGFQSDAPMAVVGQVYTIVEVRSHAKFIPGAPPVVRLVGFGAGHWHRLARFRPVKTIEDDISTHFEALLHVRNPQLEAAE